MCALKTEYCVEIRVPKKNGKHQFGSGYTLGPNWVLTAHHVLFGEEVDAARPLKITWRDTWRTETGDEKEGGKSLFLVSRDKIVWYHKEHDIALIRFEPSYKNVPGAWSLITEKKPDGTPKWESLGFLSNLANEQDNRRRVNPDGRVGRINKEDSVVDLYVDRPSPDLSMVGTNEYWKGFSGSPIFVEDRLVAVVRSVNTGENTLTASFISAALDSKGEGEGQLVLRDVPGFFIAPDRKKCWKKLQDKIARGLKDAPDVFTALQKEYLSRVDTNAEIKNAVDLTGLLYTAPNVEVIHCFNRVVSIMRKQERVQEVQIMRDLASVWLVLMAADQGTICGIEAFREDPSAQSLDLHAVEPVLLDVEAQAANAEDRKPYLCLVGKDLRSPFDLTPSHAVGLDEDDRQAAKDVRKKHNRKTKPGFEVFSLEEAKTALEKFATRPESGLSSPLSPDDDVQRGLDIDDQLEWACEELEEELEGKISYYIRLTEPISKDSCLYDLHKWCPQLLVFTVSGVNNRDRKKCLTGLHRIIHRAETFLNEHSEEL